MTKNLEKLPEYFSENFAARGELGAAVSIFAGEEEVVSLQGGRRSRDGNAVEWTADTLVPIWSATKGPAALTVLMALAEARIPVSDPVQRLWPELKAAAHRGLSFAQLLAHQSGLAALDPDKRPPLDQHRLVARALENQDPFWQAGFGHGYHPRTSGALMEEIVRRATGGMSLGAFWRERFALPHGIDIFIGGLGPREVERLATIYPPKKLAPPPGEIAFYQSLAEADSLSLAAFSSPSGLKSMGDINRIELLNKGIPSLGGVASARGLAAFYAILANGGRWKGFHAVPEKIAAQLSVPLSDGPDYTLRLPTAFSTGFMLDPVDPQSGEKIRRIFGPGKQSFGHPGAGGSLAFADPEKRLSFAYVMNQMETGILPNDKASGLVNLLYF